MSDKHPRHPHRSTVEDIFGEIGTSIAVAFQTAGTAVSNSFQNTDELVRAVVMGPRYSQHRNWTRHHQQHYQQQAYPRQLYHQQHYQQQQQQQYQQEPQYQQQYQYQQVPKTVGPQNTSECPPSYNSSVVSATNISALAYDEPPPAYEEVQAAHDRPSPPAYSGPSSSVCELSIASSTKQAGASKASPPPYPGSLKSSSRTLPSAPSLKTMVYTESVKVYGEQAMAYGDSTSGNSKSPKVYGEELPVYGYPPCYHYKYTDGCKYCLQWKWN